MPAGPWQLVTGSYRRATGPTCQKSMKVADTHISSSLNTRGHIGTRLDRRVARPVRDIPDRSRLALRARHQLQSDNAGQRTDPGDPSMLYLSFEGPPAMDSLQH